MNSTEPIQRQVSRPKMSQQEMSRSDDFMERVNILGVTASYRIPELFDALGLKFRRSGKKYIGCCPVHGGDNQGAFTLYPEGYNIRGLWKCWSKSCHKVFRWTVVGLTWGVLSHQQHGYNGDSNKTKVSFRKAVDWLCDFVGKKLNTIEVDHAEIEKRKYEALAASLINDPFRDTISWGREAVRHRLIIPSAYYLDRGYSTGILDRYDVGTAITPDNQNLMFERVVVPVFDDKYKHVIGVTGRSIFEKCDACGQYHAVGACPAPQERYKKWLNSKGFCREFHLYNLWFAREHIARTKTLVLVEGPGDIWRLEEAGIHNAVGVFGTDLSDRQIHLIECLPIENCVVLTDADASGERAKKVLNSQLGSFLRMHFPHIIPSTAKDVGGTSVGHLNEKLYPFLRSLHAGF